MTLPNQTTIAMSQVNVELGQASNANIDLNSGAVRNLFGVSSGTIKMSNGWGKSAYTPPSATCSNYNPYATYTGNASVTMYSPTVNITVSNGVGPYAYYWWQVSGTTMTIGSPNSPSTYFSLTCGVGTFTGVFNCEVDDSKGSKCWIGQVTVTMEHDSTGGGGTCCWAEAILANCGKKVGAAEVGDPLLLMQEDGSGHFPHKITALRKAVEDCATIVTEGGVTLTCTYTTPIAFRRGLSDSVEYQLMSEHIIGLYVPVLDDGEFRWERVRDVQYRGPLDVVRLSCDGGVYAAGDTPDRYIFTHNLLKQ